MPQKSANERLDDCEQVEAGLQGELVQQGRRLDDLKRDLLSLEQDVKTLVMLCHRLRVFSHVHPGMEPEKEKFSVEISPLLQRYKIDPLS
jgi:hypothetical protein